MRTTRRELILSSAAAAVAAHFVASEANAIEPSEEAAQDSVVDAGPISDYSHDGVFDTFRREGLFVIRRDQTLLALSSVCTHRGCKVRAEADGSFICKCHGSTFSPDGKVLKGPATRDLPQLAIARNDKGHVLVDKGQVVQWDATAATPTTQP